MWKFGFCILAITSSVFNILDSSSSTQSTKDILLKCPTEHFPFVAISKALDHTNKNCNLYNSLRVTENLKYSPNRKVQLYLCLLLIANSSDILKQILALELLEGHAVHAKKQ